MIGKIVVTDTGIDLIGSCLKQVGSKITGASGKGCGTGDQEDMGYSRFIV
jgi:hypothetical protein